MSDYDEQIEALKAKLEEAKAFHEGTNNELGAILNEKMILQQQYDDSMKILKEKQLAAQEKAYQAKKHSDQLYYEMTALEQKKAAEAAAAKAAVEEAERLAREQAEMKVLTERFDALTLRASWREWAKDHQIQGAHKIVQDRNVILADPMGLGKTLTAIITVEMAERATKDTSPEFPFLGEEREFYISDTWTRKSDGQPFKYQTMDIKENPQDYDFTPGGVETKIVNAIERPVGRRVLYLCPNALIKNVYSEWKMWAPHRNVIFLSNMTRDERQFAMEFVLPHSEDFVVILNFEAWRRDWALVETLAQFKFDTVIIDEAHNAKDHKSIVWKGIHYLIQGRRASVGSTSSGPHRPEYIIPMTGTPILNRPQELFTLLNMVDPENFYHENDFLYQYCIQDMEGRWKFKSGGMDSLQKRLTKVFLRRTKDQAGIVLPEKVIIHHDIDMDKQAYAEQAKARSDMAKFMTLKLKQTDEFGAPKAMSAAAVIAMYTRLRQIETWPAGIIQRDPKTKEVVFQLDVEESQKLDYIISKDGQDGLIPETIEDERIVLFSQFKAPLHELKSRIEAAGYRAVVLDGETPDEVKEQIRIDFDRRHTPERSQAKWDVVLCNYRVGGVGLNLTAATQMIICDEEWNPGKRDQAYDRLHRIGQTESVTIHVLRMKNSIDDWLAEIMENKENLVDGFNQITNGQSLKDFLEGGFM